MLGGEEQTEDTCTVLIAANISLLIRAKLNYNSFHSHRDNRQSLQYQRQVPCIMRNLDNKESNINTGCHNSIKHTVFYLL